MPSAATASAYPSPPSFLRTEYLSLPSDDRNMGGSGPTNADGVGTLTYQRAIDIARNTEGDLDPTVSNYLEGAIGDIWSRINEQQDSYILTKDEFAVFNYYIRRFEGNTVAEQAIDRYWRVTAEPSAARR